MIDNLKDINFILEKTEIIDCYKRCTGDYELEVSVAFYIIYKFYINKEIKRLRVFATLDISYPGPEIMIKNRRKEKFLLDKKG